MAERKYSQQRNELAMKLLRELYRGIDGRELSLQGRKKMDDNASLTYGEIVPQSFIQILLSVTSSSSPNKVFIDLGCGVGVAVMTAALSSCRFETVWGIELLPELLDAANSAHMMLLNFLSQGHTRVKDQKLKSESSPEGLHDDLNHSINSIFEDLSVSSLAIEILVDRLCKAIGHKEYKKMLKGFKSFKRFLSQFPQKYVVNGEEVTKLPQEPDFEFDKLLPLDQLQLEESSEKPISLSVASDTRRQTRPDAILALLATPIGQTLLLPAALPTIQFDCHDIFELNWWDTGDVVYCASLLFSDEMMTQLLERVWRMKPGAYFISLKPFPSRNPVRQGDSIFEIDGRDGRRMTLVSDSFYRMSWQMARVYIYHLGARVAEECQNEQNS
jgi:hypothetical protein